MRPFRVVSALALILLLAWLSWRAASGRRAQEELARGGGAHGAAAAAAGIPGGALRGTAGPEGAAGPRGAGAGPSSPEAAGAAAGEGTAASAAPGQAEGEEERLERVSAPDAARSSMRSSASSGRSAAVPTAAAARPAAGGRVSEPDVESIEKTFSSFLKRMREKAGPAAERRRPAASYGSEADVERVSTEEMRAIHAGGSEESSILRMSPTYKRLKQAQKNNLDAASMSEGESDGKKARAGAWSDGNTVQYNRIPIRETRGAFGSREVGAAPKNEP